MNDAYYEQLVTRKSRPTEWLIRFLIIFILLAVLVFGLPFVGFFIIPIVLIFAVLAFYFVFPRLNVEYEYTILNHELQIDAIYNKARRKTLLTVDIKDAEVIAPKGSSELNYFKADKTLNYTSGYPGKSVYVICVPVKQVKTAILLEPNDKMIEHIKNWTGSKFHTN